MSTGENDRGWPRKGILSDLDTTLGQEKRKREIR